MSRFYQVTFISVLVVATLACGLTSSPISDAKNLAATAEAAATSLPANLPDIGQYLNPVGTPAPEWKGIPIMTQATAGQEFNDGTYSYKVSGVSESDIEAFYNQQLPALGWKSSFNAPGNSEGGFMLFTNDSGVLSISIAQADSDFVVLLITQ